MGTILRTDRLRLRTWAPTDEGLFAETCNVPEVTSYLGGVLPERKQKELFEWLLEQQKEYDHTFWPVEDRSTGEFLGICGLVTVDEQDSTVLGATELGYRLKPSAQGKGFGREGAQACLDYAFDQEEAWWVVSRTTVENVGSWMLMRSVGMRHDPRLDYTSTDGTPFIVHVMTRDEWRESRKSKKVRPSSDAG